MNKYVFEYLNGKAQQVTDYIRTKAEVAENYLSEHAQDIKQGAIKTTATVLTAATLMGGMTGCNSNNTTMFYPMKHYRLFINILKQDQLKKFKNQPLQQKMC